LREALEPLGIPVLGALRRDERIATPERHLGLVPAGEREASAREALATLAEAMSRCVDLDEIERIARGAPELVGTGWSGLSDVAPAAGASTPDTGGAAGSVRVALAAGPAFSFHYEENLELLRAAGAELVPFDPLSDEALPADADALVLAGGFPEVYGAELEANARLRAQVAAFATSGRPVLAECGGLLYLSEDLDGHEMCGALPLRVRMTERLTLGYRDAVAATATPWLAAGERVRGHEFHYTQVEPAGDEPPPAWTLTARGHERTEGFAFAGMQGSYLHVHWAAHPQLARRFVKAAGAARAQPAAAA
jgi:cobyrinic acid a,c-diamide synthase